jgi:ribosomal protein L37E
MENNLHKCDAPTEAKYYIYGDAIYECYEHGDGTLRAGNGEYESQVDFCPYCGYSAKVKIKPYTNDRTKEVPTKNSKRRAWHH